MLTGTNILKAIERGEADTYPILKPMNIEEVVNEISYIPGPKVHIHFEEYEDPSSGRTRYKTIRTPVDDYSQK